MQVRKGGAVNFQEHAAATPAGRKCDRGWGGRHPNAEPGGGTVPNMGSCTALLSCVSPRIPAVAPIFPPSILPSRPFLSRTPRSHVRTYNSRLVPKKTKNFPMAQSWGMFLESQGSRAARAVRVGQAEGLHADPGVVRVAERRTLVPRRRQVPTTRPQDPSTVSCDRFVEPCLPPLFVCLF